MKQEHRLEEKIGNITRRQHLIQIGSQTGIYSDELNPIPLPEAGLNVWVAFSALTNSRSTIGGMGGEIRSITYTEIEAYKRLMKIELAPSEVDLIRRLDSVYLKLLSDGFSKSTNKHQGNGGRSQH